MALKTRFFVFGKGLAQDTDDRLKDADAPRAIENLVKRKNGRLGVRYDYDALAMTERSAATLTVFDLHSYNGRMMALATTVSQATFRGPVDFAEFVNQPTYGWVMDDIRAAGLRLTLATNVQDILHDIAVRATGAGGGADDVADVAAGSGRILCLRESGTAADCVEFSLINESGQSLTEAAPTASVHSFTDLAFARVVCTGTKFFLGGVKPSTGAINLFVLDPAVSGVFTALPDPAAAGGAVTCFDMSLSHEGTTFVMAYNRAGPTTRIHEFDANGTETQDFAGVAVAFNAIGVFAEAVNAAQKRVHVMGVVTATSVVNLYTYILPTTALENSTLAFTGVSSSGQPSMAVNGGAPTTTIRFAWSDTATSVQCGQYNNSTHGAVAQYLIPSCRLNSKINNANNRNFAAVTTEASSTPDRTHKLILLGSTSAFQCSVQTKLDPLLAIRSRTAQLPTITRDVSTDVHYWPRFVISSQATAFPVVALFMARMNLCATHRRQSAQVGDALYVAGGLIQVHDGTVAAEAAFIDRPVITAAVGAAGGAKTLLGVYQIAVTWETYDRNGNYIQSEPSDVTEVTLTGVQAQINTTVICPQTIRGTNKDSDLVLVFWSTLNTAGGNITLHRDTDINVTRFGVPVTVAIASSDVALSVAPILYSQGARGALSGPLPFVAPRPAVSIAASADRILTGCLSDTAMVQESRPHIEFEQINWSDALGFQRDARGQVLAVARLDERRIIWTDVEIFEMDGPGLDDNGNGDLGAPRRLPSDVGLYGGLLGWCSIVECSLGILFRGLVDQIYLLPRGGVTPLAMGAQVQDVLLAYPTTTAAVYLPDDQTVRFTCNNAGNTDSIVLLLDVRFGEWFVEGPFGAPIAAAARFQGSVCHLRSGTVFKQRTSHPPLAFIANAWRSGTIHPFGPGNFGMVDSVTFYGEYRGDCVLTCTMTFDDLTTEVLQAVTVNGLTVGQPYSHKFTANQLACESVRVDFDITALPSIQVAFESDQTVTVDGAGGRMTIPLPAATNRRIGDRLVINVGYNVDVSSVVPTAFGWRVLNVVSTTAPGIGMFTLERQMDGTESSSVEVTLTSGLPNGASLALVKTWVVRGQHGVQLCETSIGTNTNAAGTTNDIANLAPTWGSAANLWLVFLALESETTPPQITVFPAGFVGTGERQSVSGIAALDITIGWARQNLTAAALNPTAFTYGNDGVSTRSVAVQVALRPADVITEGLVYHYWTMDHDATGTSALKSPTQMS